ncbi:hypothetical protein ACWGFX_16930 [Streptomyces xanthophaeus]
MSHEGPGRSPSSTDPERREDKRKLVGIGIVLLVASSVLLAGVLFSTLSDRAAGPVEVPVASASASPSTSGPPGLLPSSPVKGHEPSASASASGPVEQPVACARAGGADGWTQAATIGGVVSALAGATSAGVGFRRRER